MFKNYKNGRIISESKNRFICNVEIDGKIRECYVPSSGRLSTLMDDVSKEALLLPVADKNARTRYSLFIVKSDNGYILVDLKSVNTILYKIEFKLDLRYNNCHKGGGLTMKEKIAITKGARQFGYLIWNSKNGSGIEKMLQGREAINVNFNGFDLGEKHIDYKYHRISLGYKLTRAMPQEHTMYEVSVKDDSLEVKSDNGQ